MTNGNIKFVGVLTAFACFFLMACENPIMEKWWVERDDTKIIYITLPGEEIVSRVRIIQIDYVDFSGNTAVYNGPNPDSWGTSVTEEQKANNDALVKEMARILNDDPGLLVQLSGHANPVAGTEEEAEELRVLSEARAEAVIVELENRGVNRKQLINIGFSPRVYTSDQEHGNLNRCVELIVIQILEE